MRKKIIVFTVDDVDKHGIVYERLDFKVPAEIKQYLNMAAARESIEKKRNVSLTEYFCELVRADMERHKS